MIAVHTSKEQFKRNRAKNRQWIVINADGPAQRNFARVKFFSQAGKEQNKNKLLYQCFNKQSHGTLHSK